MTRSAHRVPSVLHDERKVLPHGSDDRLELAGIVDSGGRKRPVATYSGLGRDDDVADRVSPETPPMSGVFCQRGDDEIAELAVGDVVGAHHASSLWGGLKADRAAKGINARIVQKPRKKREIQTVSLRGKGWCVVGTCVAVIRLNPRYDGRGFAVGVQAGMRTGGIGRVWPGLKKVRRRAAELAALNNLPIVESI